MSLAGVTVLATPATVQKQCTLRQIREVRCPSILCPLLAARWLSAQEAVAGQTKFKALRRGGCWKECTVAAPNIEPR
jgi:hypothetical protein